MIYSRRTFTKRIAMASASAPFINLTSARSIFSADQDKLNINIFSKHLQFLDLKEAGQVAAELGFDGIDLTVRSKGHILPETAPVRLPEAIKEINASGSSCKMMTTEIEDASNEVDRDIIKVGAASGIQFYRANWYSYQKDMSMPESLNLYKEKIQRLSEVNRKYQIVGCYQNHAGTKIGASYWEIQQLLSKADPKYFGAQYDIRHAVADGGFSWENGLKLLHKQIKTIVLKDFIWSKKNGQWKAVNVPIGEGMVDFSKYFKLLKHYGLHPPISLHLEYPLGGAEKGRSSITVDKKIVYDAMKHDLMAIQELWKHV